MTDPRLTAANGRVAAMDLMGKVKASRYVAGAWKQCCTPVSDIRLRPGGPVSCQLLYGERFRVLEDRSGWSFGQSERDGYTGYVSSASLGETAARTHWVKCLSTCAYPEPDIKTAPCGWFPFGARLAVSSVSGSFCEVPGSGFVPGMHLFDENSRPSGVLPLARLFLGLPYLWGGNGPLGIDCSGLVQMVLNAAGHDCPRDSDMQWSWMDRIASRPAANPGDFVFWDGHVGILEESEKLIHATAHFMQVVCEPLEPVMQRIAERGDTGFLGFARPPRN